MTWRPGDGAPGRILLIQLRRIGDAVLLAPTLDALREAWPQSRLHLLTSGPIPDLFRGDERLHVIWPRPVRAEMPGLLKRLRGERFDLVLDFQSLPLTTVISRATGGFTIGFRRPYRGWAYTRAVDLADHAGSDYAADHKLDLLRAAGLNPGLRRPRLAPRTSTANPWAAAGDAPRLAVVPVSLREHKRWTPEAFARTVQLLHQRTGCHALLAAGPGEGEPLAAVSARLDGIPHRVQLHKSLQDFAFTLQEADLYLGNDNGPRHMALALGTPTLSWFGTQNPSHWTPPAATDHPVLWDPARARGRPVHQDLVIVPETPEAAAEAGVRLLASSGSVRG